MPKARMNHKQLKVGDRIRIVALPGAGVKGYYMDSETREVFRKLVLRKRSVRIAKIDEDGTPWYTVRFKQKDGSWDCHYLAVLDTDDNWLKVSKP